MKYVIVIQAIFFLQCTWLSNKVKSHTLSFLDKKCVSGNCYDGTGTMKDEEDTYTGTFKEGRLDTGLLNMRLDNGLRIEIPLKSCIADGEVIWRDQEQIMIKSFYKSGNLHGPTAFYSGGEEFMRMQYDNGEPQGYATIIGKSGNRYVEIQIEKKLAVPGSKNSAKVMEKCDTPELPQTCDMIKLLDRLRDIDFCK